MDVRIVELVQLTVNSFTTSQHYLIFILVIYTLRYVCTRGVSSQKKLCLFHNSNFLIPKFLQLNGLVDGLKMRICCKNSVSLSSFVILSSSIYSTHYSLQSTI